MKMKFSVFASLFLLAVGCNSPSSPNSSEGLDALTAARDVAVRLNTEIESDHRLTAQSADGVPIIVVEIDSQKSDFEGVVRAIVDSAAIRSMEGPIQIAVEMETEPPNRDADPPFLGAREIVASYDAKTGVKLP